MTEYDGTVVERKSDPEAVEREEREYRPQPHPLEQVVQWPEQ